jgi:cobalt-zinc-cadmium efflux system protein
MRMHVHGHGPHAHHHEGHTHPTSAAHGAQAGRRLQFALALTFGFMLVEVVAALWSGSLALLADAAHMLTDSGALLLALLADGIARRPADARRSFGYGRAKVLASFVNGLGLFLLGAWIVVEALQRLWQPTPILGWPVVAVGLAGFAVNLLVYAVLHRGTADINVRGAAAHVLGDLLGSAAAVIAGSVILLTGWMPIDALLSLLVAALILRTALRLVRSTGHILLEGSPPEIDTTALRAALLATVPGVRDVHHVHAWRVGDDEIVMTLHVVAAEGQAPDALIRSVHHALEHRYGPLHTTVQIEHAGCEGSCT